MDRQSRDTAITLEKTEGAINNEQSRDNINGYTRNRMTTNRTKNTTQKTKKDEQHGPIQNRGSVYYSLVYYLYCDSSYHYYYFTVMNVCSRFLKDRLLKPF